MSSLYLELLRATAADVSQMAEYESGVAQSRLQTERVRAWNAFERTTAFERAKRKQTVADLRLFIEYLISRPHPPAEFEEDDGLWEVVREQLGRQLAGLR